MDEEQKYCFGEIIRLLKSIAASTGTTADDSYQFPRPTETTFQLAAGETYTRTLYPQRRLRRLTISAPSDVVIVIKKDGLPWRRYNGIFTYDDGINGTYFNQFDISAQNTGNTPCVWGVVATFV